MLNKLLLLVLLNGWAALAQGQGLEFVMDMVHNNPGEQPYDTKYNDPAYLKAQGFTATTPHWYINCLITYDNYQKNLVPARSADRKWILAKAKEVDKKLAACKKAGLQVYPFTDFIVFPTAIWQRQGDSLRRAGSGGGVLGGRGESRLPDIHRPATQALLRAQIDGIFTRFPQLDGLVLRFGETYLFDTPFHQGGSPIRPGMAGVEDQILFINLLREEICVKRNKKLFYRTWDFGYNFHTNPAYYLAVTNAVAPHPNLVFSIKYQQDDFLRMTPFNPTLGIGQHRQIVEAQSRMEAYGKGAHPYYSAFGVINGWPETKYEIKDGRFTGRLNDPANPRGIKDILSKGLLCGVNTWSNGGGWQGPYITNEIWTDLNTYVVAQWAQNPSRSEEAIFYEFAAQHGMAGMQADRFRQLALLSIEGVRKGQCNSFVGNNKWWSRDEFFSVADNRASIQEIVRGRLQAPVLAEKAEATAIWHQIEALSRELTLPDTTLLAGIRVSSTYGRIKYELIEQMWILMLADAAPQPDAAIIRPALARYDALWREWRALKASSPQCATLYTELAFRNREEGSIGELVAKLRRLTP